MAKHTITATEADNHLNICIVVEGRTSHCNRGTVGCNIHHKSISLLDLRRQIEERLEVKKRSIRPQAASLDRKTASTGEHD